ncbi:MAG: NUDIX domain-containing protein, partial [Thermoleophilia bacterium]
MKNRVLSTSQIYDGRIINLRLDEVELPDGRHAQREVVEHPGACVIVPVDQQGRVYLVRQYRDAAAEELLELPAGKLEPGEEPLACARRECLEELGLEAGSWTHLASFYSSPGFCDELLHCFLARELRQGVSDA